MEAGQNEIGSARQIPPVKPGPRTVRMQAYNLQGQLFEVTAGDMAARVIQHEADHLAGILYIDKMSEIGQMASRSALREFEYEFAKAQERGQIPSDKELRAALERGDLPELPPPAEAPLM